LHALTGERVWAYDTLSDGAPGQFHGAVVIAVEVVVVGSDSHPTGYLYAFEKLTGRARWKIALGGGVASRVHRSGDAVLGISVRGTVVSADPATGAVRWQSAPSGSSDDGLAGDSVLIAGRLFVPWRSGRVDALNASTGELVWSRQLDARLSTSVAGFENELVVGAEDGRLLRLSSANGELVGSFDQGERGGYLYGTIVATAECVLLLETKESSGPAGASGDSSLSCVEPRLGNVRWAYSLPRPWTTLRPIADGGEVIVGALGLLIGLSLGSGQEMWKWLFDFTPRGLGTSPNHILVGTREGLLFAIERGNGGFSQAGGAAR
jgi:outer membrane protein assembly factor BamB